MELVRGFHNLQPRHRGCVITIGNYDGLHVGHQVMLKRLRERAAEFRVPACVMSFEPSPREYLASIGRAPLAPGRLSRFREKFQNLADFGVDRFICGRFNEAIRAQSPESFVKDILFAQLGAKWIVVGNDFRFAEGRKGTTALLREMGATLGFGVDEVPPYSIDGERVSSSLVREALGKGDMARAKLLLGRPYRMTGKVIVGKRLGRTLGFPTANLALHRRVVPMTGIFAVRVSGGGLNQAPGVAYIGTRPTVHGVEPLLEPHIFDFDGNLYGKNLQVDFIAFVRGDATFEDLDALTAQMNRDAAKARELLGSS